MFACCINHITLLVQLVHSAVMCLSPWLHDIVTMLAIILSCMTAVIISWFNYVHVIFRPYSSSCVSSDMYLCFHVIIVMIMLSWISSWRCLYSRLHMFIYTLQYLYSSPHTVFTILKGFVQYRSSLFCRIRVRRSFSVEAKRCEN
jgi:hypothetical protein